jgi:tetratricopeptide (TPR) repeat protein
MNKLQNFPRWVGIITTVLLMNCHSVKAEETQGKIGGVPTLCHLKVLPVGDEGIPPKLELFKQYLGGDKLESARLIYQSITNPQFKSILGKELIDRHLTKKQTQEVLPIIDDLASIKLKGLTGEEKVQANNEFATYYIKAGNRSKALPLLQSSVATLKSMNKVATNVKVKHLVDHARNYLLLNNPKSAIASLNEANGLLNKAIANPKNTDQLANITIQTDQIVPLYQEAGNGANASKILANISKVKFKNNSDRIRALVLVTKSALKIGNQTLADTSFNQTLKTINTNQSNSQKLANLKILQSLWTEPAEKTYLDKTIAQLTALSNTADNKINQDAITQIITNYLTKKDFDNALATVRTIKDPFDRGMGINEITKEKLLSYGSESKPINITPEFINFIKQHTPEMEEIFQQITDPKQKKEFISVLTNYYLFSDNIPKAIDLINANTQGEENQKLKLETVYTLLFFGNGKKAQELLKTIKYQEEELIQAIGLMAWVNPQALNQDLIEIIKGIKNEDVKKGILLKMAETHFRNNELDQALAILPITEKDQQYPMIMSLIAVKYAERGDREKAINISKNIPPSPEKKMVDDLLKCSEQIKDQ